MHYITSPRLQSETALITAAMTTIFTDFARLLETRFNRAVPTTEDSVRYTLFAAMLRNDIEPDAVILEFPHPVIARAQVDTWMPAFRGIDVAIEFKYDRDPPGGKNQPKTQKAGAVFADLRRLRLLSDRAVCYFVYVTTKEMDVYFRNPRNGHKELYELLPGKSVEIRSSYFSDKPRTFKTAVRGAFEAMVTGVLKQRFGSHSLRVYNVDQVSN